MVSPFEVMTALEEMGARLAAMGDPAWPGFDPVTVPVAIYDGTETLLFRHPAPPAEFRPAGGEALSICPGLHPAVRANSVSLIGEVLTATVMTAAVPVTPGMTPAATVAAVTAHEAFHVYQWQHHPKWGADESQALLYPVTSVPVHHLVLMEMEALERALAAGGADLAAPWVRLALVLRRQRYALLSPGAATYERSTERLEGLAHYVEMRYAAAASPDVGRRPLRFGPAEVRLRSYAVGQALATLLDRVAPAWKERLTQNDTLFLDELLELAVPSDIEPAALPDGMADALMEQAGRAVAEVESNRQARREAFAASEGWCLEVVASAAEPLRPHGFDPMNLHVLSGTEVLHTRWLRLATGDGSAAIEAFGETLTEAAGAHPLFAGVARMVVAGLAEEPRVELADGVLTVSGGGVEGTCRNATALRMGQRIVIRLG